MCVFIYAQYYIYIYIYIYRERERERETIEDPSREPSKKDYILARFLWK